jgi:hypothetical protein
MVLWKYRTGIWHQMTKYNTILHLLKISIYKILRSSRNSFTLQKHKTWRRINTKSETVNLVLNIWTLLTKQGGGLMDGDKHSKTTSKLPLQDNFFLATKGLCQSLCPNRCMYQIQFYSAGYGAWGGGGLSRSCDRTFHLRNNWCLCWNFWTIYGG